MERFGGRHRPTAFMLHSTTVTLGQYETMYNTLPEEGFPFNMLFNTTDYTDGKNITTQKTARKVAFSRASKKFLKTFDIKRSYLENKGDNHKLKKDVVTIFWKLYRDEFPKLDTYLKNTDKYEDTARDVYEWVSIKTTKEKIEIEEENKKRGARKRYDKEISYRNNIGDEKFNSNIIRDKQKKYSKGPDTDKEYLEYIKWRNREMESGNSKYFIRSYENRNVKHAEYTFFGDRNYKSFCMQDKEMFSLLKEILEEKKWKVDLEMEEIDFCNFSKQYVWSEKELLPVVCAIRERKIKGNVYYYAFHESFGVLVSLEEYKKGFYKVFPDEYLKFTDYRDPETGTFVGNSKLMTNYSLLRSLKGKIKLSFRTKDFRVNVTNIKEAELSHTKCDSLEYVKEYMVSCLNPHKCIEKRLDEKIKLHHERKHKDGIAIKNVIDKKVMEKLRDINGDKVTRLEKLVKLLEIGHINKQEYEKLKAEVV